MMINYLPNLSGPLPAAFFFASKNEKKMSVEWIESQLPSSFFWSSRCFSLNAISSSSNSLLSFLGFFLQKTTYFQFVNHRNWLTMVSIYHLDVLTLFVCIFFSYKQSNDDVENNKKNAEITSWFIGSSSTNLISAKICLSK